MMIRLFWSTRILCAALLLGGCAAKRPIASPERVKLAAPDGGRVPAGVVIRGYDAAGVPHYGVTGEDGTVHLCGPSPKAPRKARRR